MSFNSTEISTQDGRPVALYKLEWGNTVWRYTSADRNIDREELVDGETQTVTYIAVAISDNGMVQGGSAQNDFTVDCPANLPIVPLFRSTPPSESIELTVRRQHIGEPDAPIYWIGNVTNVKAGADLATAQILGAPITASFRRTGLRLCWTRECPHFLYDSNCRVDPAAFEVSATVATLTGNSFSVDDLGGRPDGWFRGGYVEWVVNADGTKERRMIEDHVGLSLVLLGTTIRMAVGTAVKLYPGCNRTPQTCKDKFNNLANSGDFHFMPGVSPFGTQIF